MTDTTEVQRFDRSGDKDPNGEHVRATDYDALAAKLAEVKEDLEYWETLAAVANDRAEAAEARIAHLENHIEGVAKDTHKIMVAAEAALPAVYRLALEDAYWSREVTPTPTAAELMARIQTGEKE